jgi:hypothetical protein
MNSCIIFSFVHKSFEDQVSEKSLAQILVNSTFSTKCPPVANSDHKKTSPGNKTVNHKGRRFTTQSKKCFNQAM